MSDWSRMNNSKSNDDSDAYSMLTTMGAIFGALAFVALMIFGIGHVVNEGSNGDVQITKLCTVHPNTAICESDAFQTRVSACDSDANSAAAATGNETLSREQWGKEFQQCMSDAL